MVVICANSMFDLRLCVQPVRKGNRHVASVILSRVKTVSSQENHSQHASPLSQLSNLLCRHLARLMPHAGAKDEYNSIEGLLAPVRAGALQPLSGRYLMALAAGQGSLMWSLLVLGIDFRYLQFSFVCCGFKCVISPVRPESAITPQIRRRETPAATRFAGRGLLTPGG